MAKETLLDIVQEILSDMNSDAVNSISDTEEALQVATIVKRTFLNLVNDRLWPSTASLFQLEASGDSARPTHVRLPEDVIEIEWCRYNVADAGNPIDYQTMLYMEPQNFVNMVMSRDPSKPNVQTVFDFHGVPLLILNDHSPTYYTTFDDQWLVFDSYDSTTDSTLQSSKLMVSGLREPEWQMSDSFVPNMPAKFFPYLINESKSVAFLKLKEVFSQKDEQASNRQKSWLSQKKARAQRYEDTPNYGRNSSSGGRYSRAGYRNNHFTG